MFIAKSKFKALLKEAFKLGRLSVGMDEEEMCYIDGVLWHIEIPRENLSNTIKAQIVELTGELPAAGEAYTYKKEEKQLLMLETMKENLWQQYQDGEGIFVKKTRISVQTDQGEKIIFQGKLLHDAYLIPGDFIACIDAEEMERDETMKDPKIINNMIIYAGNQMTIRHRIHTPKFQGEQWILNAVDGMDMGWIQCDAERI